MSPDPPIRGPRSIPAWALVPFVAITFAITWGTIGFYILRPDLASEWLGEISGHHPAFVLATWGPAIAGLLIVFAFGGGKAVAGFLSRLLVWRCPLGWGLFVAFGVPLVFVVGSLLKGGPLVAPVSSQGVGVVVRAALFMLLLGPVEELGWRGVAQPLLQRHVAPIWAGLLIGATWGLWHLPAFYLSGTVQSGWSFTPFFVGNVALAVLVTPLFNSARGSILLPMLFHWQLINPLWPDAQPWDTGLFVGIAVAAVWIHRSTMFTREGAVIDVVPPSGARAGAERSARPLTPPLAVLVVCVTACSPDGPAADSPGPGSPATDSPGTGPWVVRNGPPFPVGELSPEPVVRIGALEGPTAVEFTELTYVASLTDGGIVALDRGPNEIRWFDSTGAFEHQAGGRGEGPGEFMYPVAATVQRGDTVVVYDGRTRRLTAFDPSGSLGWTRQLEISSAFGVRLGTNGDGRLMAVEHRATFAMDGSEYNYARDTLVLMVPSAETVDTVARLPGPESVTWVDYVGGRPAATRQMELPLGEVALAAPTREGFAFVPPGEQGLSYRSLDGEAYGRGERTDLPPVEASPAIRDQYVARALAEMPRGGPPPGVIEEDLEARFALLGDDPTVPPWDRILVAGDGRSVWLRRYRLPAEEGAPSSWSVYGLDGAIQAELRVPAAFRPTHIAGDRIAGIETDGLGVEYAVVYSWWIR